MKLQDFAHLLINVHTLPFKGLRSVIYINTVVQQASVALKTFVTLLKISVCK